MKYKLKVFITILLLPILVSVAISVYYVNILQNKIWKENESYIFQILEGINNRIDDIISRVDYLIMMAGDNKEFKEALTESEALDANSPNYGIQLNKINQQITASFTYMSYSMPGIRNIVVIDKNGKGYFVGQDKFDYSYEFEQSPVYRSIIEADGSKVVVPLGPREYLSLSYGESFSIARVLKDKETYVPICTIIIDIDSNILKSACGEMKDSMIHQIMITTDTINLLYNTNGNNFLSPKEQSVLREYELEKTPSANLMIDNDNFIITKDRSSYTDFFVYSLIRYSDLIHPISQLVKTGVIAFLIVFGIAIFLTLLLTQGTTRRILKIEELTGKVAKGNFNVEFDTTGKDEISELAASLNTMTNEIKALIEEEHSLVIKEKQTRIDYLSSQINPHYLYNVLNAAYMSSIANNDMETADFTKNISDLLKFIVTQKQLIPLTKEIEILKKYIQIQQMRYSEDKISIKYDISKGTLDYFIPKLLLQPIIENSIIHGLLESDKKGLIKVHIDFVNEPGDKRDILINISDNGSGMSDDAIVQMNRKLKYEYNHNFNKSIGIYNVNERIKLHYGEAYGISIEKNKDGGVTVSILINNSLNDVRDGNE